MSHATALRYEHQPDHNHQLVLYESSDEQFESVTPFVQNGLEDNDQLLYVVHDNTVTEVKTALRRQGFDIDAAIESGQISFADATDIYLSDGVFNPEQMIDCIDQQVSQAIEKGYDRLRITAEMTWAAEYDVSLKSIKAYEQQVDALFPTDSLIGQCQYRRTAFPVNFLSDMLESHSRITYNGEPRPNCYHKPPNELGGEATEEELNRKLKTVSEQHNISTSLDERERCLSLLGQLTEQLRNADVDEVTQIAGDIITEIVNPSLVAFFGYTRTEGELETDVIQNTLEEDTEEIIDAVDEQTWNAFVENECQDITERPSSIRGVILPVGQHGVYLIATPAPNPISDTDRHFLQAVTGHTEASLDQITHERQLKEQHDTLAEHHAQLQRVNQINSVVREMTQSLVEATTTDDVTQAVCDLLVEKTCADFAWFGTYESATELIQPEQKAGDGQGYVKAMMLEDDWKRYEPSGRTARSQTVTTIQQIYDEPPLQHWQEQALKRNFQSMVSLPVDFDNSMFGILSVYSTTPNTFDDEVVSVFEELSDCMAYAFNSINRKQALVTEEVIELDIRVTDTNLPIVEFVNEHDCRVDINEVVSGEKAGFRVFAEVSDTSATKLQEFAAKSPTITDIEILSSTQQTLTVECNITDQCVTVKLLNHNTVPQSIRVEDGEAHLKVRLRQDHQVRRFIEMFQSMYPSAEVVARRNQAEPLRRAANISTQIENELTDRQLEILKLAFHSEYFERPRGRTAEDLADELDVSHPTVSRHLREAERRVFSLLFEDN